MVKRYAAKAGIDNNVSSHTLRHSFATDLYRETSKIRLVQKVLGHSNLSTTMIYTNIFDEEVENPQILSPSGGGSGVRRCCIGIGDNEIEARALKDTA